jgi:hypothetical protein
LTCFFFPRRDESFPACYLSSANRGATADRPRDRPIVGHDYDFMSCDHQLYVCALSCNAVTRFHMVTSVPALVLYAQSTPTRLFHCKNARQWSIHGIRSGRRILAIMVVSRSYYCTKENLVPIRLIPRSCWFWMALPEGIGSLHSTTVQLPESSTTPCPEAQTALFMRITPTSTKDCPLESD